MRWERIRSRWKQVLPVVFVISGSAAVIVWANNLHWPTWIMSGLLVVAGTLVSGLILISLQSAWRHQALLIVIVRGYIEALSRSNGYSDQIIQGQYSFSKIFLEDCRASASKLMGETQDPTLAQHLFWLNEMFYQVQIQVDRAADVYVGKGEIPANPINEGHRGRKALTWVGRGLAFLDAREERIIPALQYCADSLGSTAGSTAIRNELKCQICKYLEGKQRRSAIAARQANAQEVNERTPDDNAAEGRDLEGSPPGADGNQPTNQ